MIKNYAIVRDSDGLVLNVIRKDSDLSWNAGSGNSLVESSEPYSTGVATVVHGLSTVTLSTASIQTAGVKVGQKLTIGDSETVYTIASITSEILLTLDQAYDGSTSVAATYKIFAIAKGDTIEV